MRRSLCQLPSKAACSSKAHVRNEDGDATGPNSNYTLVVTSCDRHDLLKSTLESYYAHVDQWPRELIVIEDSAKEMPEFLKDFIWRQRSLKWMTNGERRGQIFSIDRAYREVQTEFIMH